MQAPRVYIIAEAGVNHNGDEARALEMVRVAARAGADAVKFQTFSADALAAVSAPRAAYQDRNLGEAGTQLDMLRALELSRDAHHRVQDACAEAGIDFLSTPFDLASLAFLVDDLNVTRLKVGSGDLTNTPLVRAVAQTGLPAILSTGMATLEDIAEALAQFTDRSGVTLLQCTSDYPAPPEAINLRAMQTLKDRFGLPVGFSDHSIGGHLAVAAVAMGATVIEKHFTLDRTLPGPDHAASLEPDELAAMIRHIRDTQAALGTGEKTPTPAEREVAIAARKSLIALTDIAAGEPFTEANLGVKRPGNGMRPVLYWDMLGTPARHAYAADDLIDEPAPNAGGTRS